MKKLGNILKRLIVICIVVYAISTFIYQQKILNTYAKSTEELDKQIVEANQRQEKLNKTKDNVNSKEYIEKMAREKLDMYKSNERVYINNQ